MIRNNLIKIHNGFHSHDKFISKMHLGNAIKMHILDSGTILYQMFVLISSNFLGMDKWHIYTTYSTINANPIHTHLGLKRHNSPTLCS